LRTDADRAIRFEGIKKELKFMIDTRCVLFARMGCGKQSSAYVP